MRRCTMRCTAPGVMTRVPVTRAVNDSRVAPVAARIFETLSVPGQRSCPSAVRRFDLLNVVGSRPDFFASPEADNPCSAASASIARQISSCFMAVIPLRAALVRQHLRYRIRIVLTTRRIVLIFVGNWNRKNEFFLLAMVCNRWFSISYVHQFLSVRSMAEYTREYRPEIRRDGGPESSRRQGADTSGAQPHDTPRAQPHDMSRMQPFHSAEEAWLWTMAALRARRDGARYTANRGLFGRPCEPDDVIRCLDALYRRRRIDLLHARILRVWGERQMAPDPGHASEQYDHRLWREALDSLEWSLRAKGIVA